MCSSDLPNDFKIRFMVETLYKEPDKITNVDDAVEQGMWFLNCGKEPDEHQVQSKKVYDWEQDEQMIFSATNKVAGKELRSVEYLHYWTFMGYFQEVEDGLLAYVIGIRAKRNKHQKLSKEELNFYTANKDMVDIKRKYTEKELEELEELDKLLGIKK